MNTIIWPWKRFICFVQFWCRARLLETDTPVDIPAAPYPLVYDYHYSVEDDIWVLWRDLVAYSVPQGVLCAWCGAFLSKKKKGCCSSLFFSFLFLFHRPIVLSFKSAFITECHFLLWQQNALCSSLLTPWPFASAYSAPASENAAFHEIIVPTQDTVRNNWFLQLLLLSAVFQSLILCHLPKKNAFLSGLEIFMCTRWIFWP